MSPEILIVVNLITLPLNVFGAMYTPIRWIRVLCVVGTLCSAIGLGLNLAEVLGK